MEWHKNTNKKGYANNIVVYRIVFLLDSLLSPAEHSWTLGSALPKGPQKTAKHIFSIPPCLCRTTWNNNIWALDDQTPRRAAQEFPQNPKRGCKASGLFPKKEEYKKKELRKLQCCVRSSWINIQGWATCFALIRGVAVKNISRLTFLSVCIILVIITTQA